MSIIADILEKQSVLLQNIKSSMPSLETLLDEVNSLLGYEDVVYRYYHQSDRVYHAQDYTLKVYRALEEISPHNPKMVCDEQFNSLVKKGTGKKHELKHNQQWEEICEPIVNAFFHSKYFLEMAIKYGKKYDEPPIFPVRASSGWAALLELYNIR